MRLLTSLSALVASTAAVQLSTVYQFPNGTWLENIAQTSHSSLLVTLIGKAEVWMVTPHPTTPATAELVASFPAHNAVLGIAEIEKDVFAVNVGNVTASNEPVNGTFGVWKMDVSGCTTAASKTKELLSLPGQHLLNGLAFHPSSSTLFVADSWAGNVLALNAHTGDVEYVLEHPLFQANFSSPSLVIGVNGLRIHDGYVYFSNTVMNLVGRFRVPPTSSSVRARYSRADVKVEVQIIKQGEEISQPDDFAVLKDGSVLLARPLGDTVQHVSLGGEVQELAKGGEVSGTTSVVLGAGGEGYVVTSGLVGGVSTEGGRVVKVEF